MAFSRNDAAVAAFSKCCASKAGAGARVLHLDPLREARHVVGAGPDGADVALEDVG